MIVAEPIDGSARLATRRRAIDNPFAFALCADDYAMAPGVSRGILEALDRGALSATSAMTNMPDWADAAPALRPFIGRADIGLHLNLTLGVPLGPMPVTAPTGSFPPIGTILRRARSRDLPAGEITAEIARQCDAFESAFGRPPNHVDGHQHVHMLASVRGALLTELRRRKWTPAIRDSTDRPWRIIRRGVCRRKALVVAALGQGFAPAARAAGLCVNDGFAGYSHFGTADDVAPLFRRYLAAPGPRHLVMCHPGYVDETLRGLDPIHEPRERELRFLLSRDFDDVLAQSGASVKRLTAMA